MHPVTKGQASKLEDIPNIGKSIASDLRAIGILHPKQLASRKPLATYLALAQRMEHRHDPCVLYALMAAQRYLESGDAVPWWKFTDQGKNLLAAHPKTHPGKGPAKSDSRHSGRTMFTQATFDFLDELAANNRKAWFEANKARYEALVREPALDFIGAMAPVLKTFAPSFCAEPRKAGGSLMRVFRDTRFSRDKTPYKTNIGIQFRHALGKDIHAPGFYLHIATDECFFATGCWHPEPEVLWKLREFIAKKPERWFAARDDKKFIAQWELWGDKLTRPPRGFAADHPAIEDIKRKDFVAIAPLSSREATGSGLVRLAGKRFAEAAPFMQFLCEALEVTY